jgi:hypothetical protein
MVNWRYARRWCPKALLSPFMSRELIFFITNLNDPW